MVSMKHFLIGDELLPSASEGHSRAGLFGDINKKQWWVYYRTLREGDTLMKLDSVTQEEPLIYCAATLG